MFSLDVRGRDVDLGGDEGAEGGVSEEERAVARWAEASFASDLEDESLGLVGVGAGSLRDVLEEFLLFSIKVLVVNGAGFGLEFAGEGAIEGDFFRDGLALGFEELGLNVGEGDDAAAGRGRDW